MLLLVLAPTAHAASVSYTTTQSTNAIQPTKTLTVTLSVTTDVPLAGGSVHLDFAKSRYSGFAVANTPELIFTSYHEEQNDLVFLCNESVCNPGTYTVGTFTFTGTEAGSGVVIFTPKETADPQLGPLPAAGATVNFNIVSTAPATPAGPAKPKGTFVVPKDDGSGSTEPLQISNDTFTQQTTRATSTSGQATGSKTATTFWTTKHIALVGIGVAVSLSLLWLLVLKFIGSSGPKPPFGGGPGSSGSAGPPVIYTR